MSKYQNYAKEVDTLAKKVFESYTRAEKRLEKATLQRKALDEHGTQREIIEADYEVASAKTALEFAQLDLEHVTDELSEIRNRLKAAVTDDHAADPKNLDLATLELLRSGILEPHEYERLMRQAESADNGTMVRLCGKYALSAAEAAEKELGANHPKATALRDVGLLGEVIDTGGTHIMNSFDMLATALETTAKNPAMIGDWASLTADVIESF